MAALGHDRFAVVGHDRGAYVALRTALDRPAAVTALAVLGAVPIGEALARADARFATAESAGRVSALHSRTLEL
jgi:haloacetate dehalogenase